MLQTVQRSPVHVGAASPPEAEARRTPADPPQPEASEPGRRERKKRATRRALASAALRLAAERGPAGVTIEDISDAADVSPRTFFNYFGSKEEAILNLDPDGPADVRARVEARPADEPPLEALRVALTEASATQTEDAEEWSVKMGLVKTHPSLFPSYIAAYGNAERGLVEAIAARTGADPDADLYPSLVVAAALNATRVATNRWVATDRATPLAVLLRSAFDQLAGGLVPPTAPTTPADAEPAQPKDHR
jgi:AcrR family transcriptional regulator